MNRQTVPVSDSALRRRARVELGKILTDFEGATCMIEPIAEEIVEAIVVDCPADEAVDNVPFDNFC